MEEPELPVIRTPENVAKRRRIKQKKRAEGLEGPQVIVPYSSSQSAQAGGSFSVVCFFLLQPPCSSDSVKTLGPEILGAAGCVARPQKESAGSSIL